MAIARPAKKRPNQMREQQRTARSVIRGSRTKVVPTFPRRITPYDSATRRFQKRRFNVQALSAMLKSKDYVLRKLAVDRIVNSNPKIILKIGLIHLQEMANSNDPYVREAVAKAIASAGKQGLTYLREMAKDKKPYVRRAAANAIASAGKQGLTFQLTYLREIYLREMVTDKNADVLRIVANAMGNIGERGLPYLLEMATDKEAYVRRIVANAMGNIGERGLPYLKEMTKDSDRNVRMDAINAIASAGKLGLPYLQEMAKDPDMAVREAVTNAMQEITGKRFLLSSRAPFAATAYLPEILKRAKTFDEISSKMKRKFGAGFTGIVVFGSMAKGYANPESDVDYAVIASNPVAASAFKDFCKNKGLPLCIDHYVNPKEYNTSNAAPLFYGLFFGDRKALRRAQRSTFSRMNEEQWNTVRSRILENEAQLTKAFERFGITSKKEQQRLKAAAALRVPPPYKEMKQLLDLKKTTPKKTG